jgi:hypothetical protein
LPRPTAAWWPRAPFSANGWAGSGGGWQDSGGLWPAIKLIEGVTAAAGDSEFGISRGCLLPRHRILGADEVSAETRQSLQASLVLVHGGMAQDVGPILEMVTEKYLLRSEAEWQGRQQAIRTLDEILGSCARATSRPSGAPPSAISKAPFRPSFRGPETSTPRR